MLGNTILLRSFLFLNAGIVYEPVGRPAYSQMKEEPMKRLLITLVCIVGLTGIVYADELSQAEATKIGKGIEDQFTEAFKNKQVDKMVGLFTDDGWRITDMGPVTGREDLTKHWDAVFKIADLQNTHTDQIKVVDNNNILATGHWEATLRLPNQPPQPSTGFWALAISKQKDNTWKIAMEAYNVKMAAPPTQSH
jgi:ketosteroid isomerase-like protein